MTDAHADLLGRVFDRGIAAAIQRCRHRTSREAVVRLFVHLWGEEAGLREDLLRGVDG
jgi:hypothetical protein